MVSLLRWAGAEMRQAAQETSFVQQPPENGNPQLLKLFIYQQDKA
jgi:hypothetical protein